jgi:hypothetical protein
MRRLRDKLSYGNVVASLALFISLGGASYAAVALPPHSVGGRQLQRGAVSTAALSFPIGVAGMTDKKADDLVKGACNSPLQFGSAAPPCKPGIPTTAGREVRLQLKSGGPLLVSAIAGLRNEGQPQTRAHVTLAIVVDGQVAAESSVTSAGQGSSQVPIQVLVGASRGSHLAGLAVRASYDSAGPGDVVVAPVSITATALPGA